MKETKEYKDVVDAIEYLSQIEIKSYEDGAKVYNFLEEAKNRFSQVMIKALTENWLSDDDKARELYQLLEEGKKVLQDTFLKLEGFKRNNPYPDEEEILSSYVIKGDIKFTNEIIKIEEKS